MVRQGRDTRTFLQPSLQNQTMGSGCCCSSCCPAADAAAANGPGLQPKCTLRAWVVGGGAGEVTGYALLMNACVENIRAHASTKQRITVARKKWQPGSRQASSQLAL